MKQLITLLYINLLIPYFSFSQGSSCATAIPIPLDGVCRNYTTSSSTGGNLVCTDYGTTPITYFSITSNSSAQDMLLNITGPGSQAVEVGFYNGTTCNNGAFEPASSICFYDGTGSWAPAESFIITPNQTYILRIKTQTTGTIRICGQSLTPANKDCLNATQIGTILTFDNNSAHKPGTGISAGDVCASILTNTAFYYYIVDETGPSTVSIENPACDNNYGNDGQANGYQIGLFTGTCASLTGIACYSSAGNVNAQLSIGSLPAGTKVYVAFNGVMGTNCAYSVRAVNGLVLSADLKYFTAWKASEGNILDWISLNEYDNKHFEVQRSVDGVNYRAIGQITGQINSRSEKKYQFTDVTPPEHCLYRLKMVSTGGKTSYSNVVRVSRGYDLNSKVLFGNLVSDHIDLRIIDFPLSKLNLKIIDNSGRTLHSQNIKINSGENLLKINTGSIAPGMHYLMLSGENYRKAFPFVKS